MLHNQSACLQVDVATRGGGYVNIMHDDVIRMCGSRITRIPRINKDTPVFMPVGTQGTMKGVTTGQLEDVGCNMILGNTYHLVGVAVSSRRGVHQCVCSSRTPRRASDR